MPFGVHGTFPFEFGGGPTAQEVIASSLSTALSPEVGLGYDVSDPLLDVEIDSHANTVACIWATNERIAGSSIPSLMMESLPEAEQSYGINPTPAQSDIERRAVIAGKVRGINGNTLPDIREALQLVAGDQFVDIHVADDSQRWTFWSQEPGPPGKEWASATCVVMVQLTKEGLPDDAAYFRLRSSVRDLLATMLPASHTLYVGTGTGFQAGISLVGEAAV